MPVAASSSVPPQVQHAHIPIAKKSSLAGLAPSTISQWVPKEGSSASSKNQTTTDWTISTAFRGLDSTSPKKADSASLENALTPGPEEKDPWIAPGIASGSITEAPLSASEAIPPRNPELALGSASGATTSTKPEALPASSLETAPYSAPEADPPEVDPSTDPEKVFESAPQVATSSIPGAAHGTDPEKGPTSTVPAPNGGGSPASSNLEKEIDLEAGHRSEGSDKKESETTKQEVDPNIVDWDGPDDPKNPINWSEKLKWANVAVISSVTFLTQVTLQAFSIGYKMLI